MNPSNNSNNTIPFSLNNSSAANLFMQQGGRSSTGNMNFINSEPSTSGNQLRNMVANWQGQLDSKDVNFHNITTASTMNPIANPTIDTLSASDTKKTTNLNTIPNPIDLNNRKLTNAAVNYVGKMTTGYIRNETTNPSLSNPECNEATNIVVNYGDELTTGDVTSIEGCVTQSTEIETKFDDYYVMGDKHDPNKKRGRCVILNYKYFYRFDPNAQQWSVIDSETRHGNDFDVGALYATFGGLNFEVVAHSNLGMQQTIDVLKNESQLNHSNYDCFVLCILSHGQCGNLGVIEYEHVFGLFEVDSLKNKPKLFFIEACLGSAYNYAQGSTAQPSAPPVPNPPAINPNPLRFLPDNMFAKSLKADMLAFYATYPGFVSLSHPLKGSWFIQALCQVLNQYGDREDLSKMVIKVNAKVANEVCLHVAQMAPVKQMSHYSSTITKDVKFY